MLEFSIIAACFLGGLFAGLAMLALGGMGGERKLRKRLEELDGEVTALSQRLTRDQRRRAGQERQDTRSDRELVAEAQRQAAQLDMVDQVDGGGAPGGVVGFGPMGRRGS